MHANTDFDKNFTVRQLASNRNLSLQQRSPEYELSICRGALALHPRGKRAWPKTQTTADSRGRMPNQPPTADLEQNLIFAIEITKVTSGKQIILVFGDKSRTADLQMQAALF
jgi:hypothetical protein